MSKQMVIFIVKIGGMVFLLEHGPLLEILQYLPYLRKKYFFFIDVSSFTLNFTTYIQHIFGIIYSRQSYIIVNQTILW